MLLLGRMTLASGFNEAVLVIRRAYELGVRYFDTPPLYGKGRSEVRYGRALARLPRESFAIPTKVSRILRPADLDDLTSYSRDGIPNFTHDFDFSADGVLLRLSQVWKDWD